MMGVLGVTQKNFFLASLGVLGSRLRAGGVKAAEAVSFQRRFADDHDLCCRFMRAGMGSIIEIGLEGTSPREQSLVRKALLECLEVINAPGAALGVVFNPSGMNEGLRWSSFFISREELDFGTLSRLPRLLILGYEFLGHVTNLQTRRRNSLRSRESVMRVETS